MTNLDAQQKVSSFFILIKAFFSLTSVLTFEWKNRLQGSLTATAISDLVKKIYLRQRVITV